MHLLTVLVLAALCAALAACERGGDPGNGGGGYALDPDFGYAFDQDFGAPIEDDDAPAVDLGEACDPRAPGLPQPLVQGQTMAVVDLEPIDAMTPEGDCVQPAATHQGTYHLSLATRTRLWARVLDSTTRLPVRASIRVRPTCDEDTFVCVDTEVHWMDQGLLPGEWLLQVTAESNTEAAPTLELSVPESDHCVQSAIGTLHLDEETTGEVTEGPPESPLNCGAGGGHVRAERMRLTLDAPTRVIVEVPWAAFDPILEIASNGCPVEGDVLACQDDVVPGVQWFPRIGPLTLPAGDTTFRISSYDEQTGFFGLVVRAETDTMPATCDAARIPLLPAVGGVGRVDPPSYRGVQIFQPQCFTEDDDVASLYRIDVDHPTLFEVARGARNIAVASACDGPGLCAASGSFEGPAIELAPGSHIVALAGDGSSWPIEYRLLPRLAACEDGHDNDLDGLADLDDPGCDAAADDDEGNPAPLAACSDAADNDADGQVDASGEGCEDAADVDETDPAAPAACANGLDDDADGATDYPTDTGCAFAGGPSERGDCLPLGVVGPRGGVIDLPPEVARHTACGTDQYIVQLDLDRRSTVQVLAHVIEGRVGTSGLHFSQECGPEFLECERPRVETRDFLFLDKPAGTHFLSLFVEAGGHYQLEVRTTSIARGCSDLLDNDADGLIDAVDPGCTYDLDDDETDAAPGAPVLDPRCGPAALVGQGGGSAEVLVNPDARGPVCGAEARGLGRFYLQLDRPSRVRILPRTDLGEPREASLSLQAGCGHGAVADCRTPEQDLIFERMDPGLWMIGVSVAGARADPTAWFDVQVEALAEVPPEVPTCEATVVQPLFFDGLVRTLDFPADSAVADSSCGPAPGAEIVLAGTLETPHRLVIQAGGGADTLVSVRRACDDRETELGCNNDGGARLGSRLVLDRVEAGPIFVIIDQAGRAAAVDVQIEATPL